MNAHDKRVIALRNAIKRTGRRLALRNKGELIQVIELYDYQRYHGSKVREVTEPMHADQVVDALNAIGAPKPAGPDLRAVSHGSVVLLHWYTDAGKQWVNEHVEAEPWALWGGAVAVEPRCVVPIIEGAIAEGLRVAQN